MQFHLLQYYSQTKVFENKCSKILSIKCYSAIKKEWNAIGSSVNQNASHDAKQAKHRQPISTYMVHPSVYSEKATLRMQQSTGHQD